MLGVTTSLTARPTTWRPARQGYMRQRRACGTKAPIHLSVMKAPARAASEDGGSRLRSRDAPALNRTE